MREATSATNNDELDTMIATNERQNPIGRSWRQTSWRGAASSPNVTSSPCSSDLESGDGISRTATSQLVTYAAGDPAYGPGGCHCQHKFRNQAWSDHCCFECCRFTGAHGVLTWLGRLPSLCHDHRPGSFASLHLEKRIMLTLLFDLRFGMTF